MERKNMGFTLPIDLLEKLKETSEETMIPQSRLVEKGIEKMLNDLDKQKKEA